MDVLREMKSRILCSGECNIRVDLIVVSFANFGINRRCRCPGSV